MTGVAAMTAGAGLGLIFFGGLWLTVRQLARRRRGTVLLVASRLTRLAVAGVVLYGLAWEGPDKLLAALGGLWLARGCLLRQLGGATDER